MPTLAPSAATTAVMGDLAEWRARLLDRVMWVSVAACLVPCILVTIEALKGGSWWHALFCWSGTTVLAAVSPRSRLSYRIRAAVATLMMYGFGLWLLVHGSAVGMLCLLAYPVMTVLAMDTRAGLAALALCTATLIGVGWWLQLPIPMTSGLPGDSLLRWLTIGSNLLLLGLLLTLSTGYLLAQLASALANHRRSETLLREVASQVPGMVFRLRLDDGREPNFLFVSPGSHDVLGLAPEALLADARRLAERLHPDDLRQLRSLADAVRAGERRHEAQLRATTPDGRTLWLQMQATEVFREGRTCVLNGVMTDITDRKKAEALVWRHAYVDVLTGLPNRLSLQIELARAINEAGQAGTRLAVLMVDLDRFKEVNDTQGHAGGDELLALAARRLQDCVRDGDFVARIGGDEFVLLMPRLDSVDDAEAVGRRVLGAMSRAFMVLDQRAHVSASVGIAIHPDDGSEPDDLFSHADQALYDAKARGRNRVCRYTRELHEQAQRRVRLANDLRLAVERGQLALVYQPIIELAAGDVVKAEALLRWQHPELGAVSPAEFVPIAETTGLVGEIGEWVLRTAAGQAGTWRQRLHPQFRISVNLSPLQFLDEQAPALPWADRLAELGVPGEALIVEITEGLLLDNSDAVAQRLRELRATGVQVALDDFGTGYSALAYLHRYEIDLLKIDRSFVSGEASGHTGQSLCRAVVALAEELGLQVVAEGVETAEQRDWLRGIGCHHAQGWLYGKAMPPADFERWFGTLRAPPAAGGPADEALAQPG